MSGYVEVFVPHPDDWDGPLFVTGSDGVSHVPYIEIPPRPDGHERWATWCDVIVVHPTCWEEDTPRDDTICQDCAAVLAPYHEAQR
jgi:hypothetical protein